MFDDIARYTAAAVPEPSSLMTLAAFGVGMLGLIKRRGFQSTSEVNDTRRTAARGRRSL